MADEQVEQVVDQPSAESHQDKLTDLTARATALYAVKKYEEAAELYSEAVEIQAELHGEMAEDNADLLYAYGRCLYYVAQKTSTVLGGTAASAQLKGSEKKSSKKRRANGTIKPDSEAGPSATLQSVQETAEPADEVPAKKLEDPQPESKGLFQIEGDAADWASSDEEEAEQEDAGNGEEDEEEEDDDFTTAFEILDVARVIYSRKLGRLKSEAGDQTTLRDLQMRISDIYDLQAEISLEGEKFDAAVTDLTSCLEIKEDLYTPDNSLLAECHYKLSLALEAACQVQQRDADGNPVGEISIDWKLRNEAVVQQEKAINSCKLRIEQEEAELKSMADDQKTKAQEQIDDVKDMMDAMQQRLEELRKPPVSVKAETEKEAQQELMGSVLGQMLSGQAADQKGKLAEIMAGANDLSGMVKKKKKPAASNATPIEQETSANGKRKADDEPASGPVKKVRIEDVID